MTQSRRRMQKNIFVVGLFLLTLLPFFALPWLDQSTFAIGDGRYLLLAFVFPFLGSHQAASAFLYIEDGAVRVMRGSRWFFYVVPLVLVAATALFFAICSDQMMVYFLLLFGAYTIYHYQKQNIGLFALVAPQLTDTPMRKIERRLIFAAGIAGMFVFAWPVTSAPYEGTLLMPLFGVIETGVALLIAGCILVGVALTLASVKALKPDDSIFGSLLRLFFLLCMVCFYLPMLIIEDRLLAFATFATAHALQYFLIMAFVAWNGSIAGRLTASWKAMLFWPTLSLLCFGLLTWASWTGWQLVTNAPVTWPGLSENTYKALLGAAVGFSLVHYHVDARIWRMRDELPRQFIKQKLFFLFPDQAAGGSPSTPSSVTVSR